jgi:hypothetical protein
MGRDGGQVTLVGGVLALALATGGCGVNAVKATEPEGSTTASTVSYPSVDAELGEHLYPDEKPIADELGEQGELVSKIFPIREQLFTIDR